MFSGVDIFSLLANGANSVFLNLFFVGLKAESICFLILVVSLSSVTNYWIGTPSIKYSCD